MAPIPRLKDYDGPPVLSYGFRPFFLLGSIYAGLAILLWLPAYVGDVSVPTAMAARDWHIHEMLYGFLPAIITGFLLTAIPNWTGRMPLQGGPLLVLVIVWVIGRVAVTLSAWIGWQLAAVLDLSFLLLVGAAAAREVIAGRNWRNLRIVGVVAVLLIGNAMFHGEAHVYGVANYGVRIGVGAAILLIMLVGGRVVPSFTRNWLARANPGRLPTPFDRFDAVAMVIGGLALVVWVILPLSRITGVLLALACIAHTVRLARWAGDRTWADRLVLILHIAYAFIPLGFLLAAAAAFDLVPTSAGIHAWTGGAVGTMTLAIMSRASLGHTGRSLVASSAVQVIYALVIAATLARICASLHPAWAMPLLQIAAMAWAVAFLGFAANYWAVFTGPKRGA